MMRARPAGAKEWRKPSARPPEHCVEWPGSFASRSDAEAFFVDRFGAGLAAEAWTSGLEYVESGWRPRFDVEVMAQTLRGAISVADWDEWTSIMCPTLIVRAGNGMVEPEIANDGVFEQGEHQPGGRRLDHKNGRPRRGHQVRW